MEMYWPKDYAKISLHNITVKHFDVKDEPFININILEGPVKPVKTK